MEQEREFLNATANLQSAKISPSAWDFLSFAAPGKVVLSWKNKNVPTNTYGKTGTTNTWEEFAVESQKFSENVETLRNIFRDPAPNQSGDRSDIFNWPKRPFVQKRVAAQWFTGLTLLSLHEGKVGPALEHIEAILGNARLYENEPWIVDQMIRVAISGLALNVTWHALQADGWTEPQLARLQHDWEAVNFPQMLERGYRGERLIQFAAYDIIKAGRLSKLFRGPKAAPNLVQDYFLGPLWSAMYGDADFLFAQRFMETQIETFRRLKAHEPWVLLKQKNEKEHAEFEKALNVTGPAKYKHLLSAIMIPNFVKAGQSAINNETFRHLTLVAIALKRFQLQHGKLPENLDALVPQFLDKVPLDYMDARPLKYRLNADGTFTLYSVGENGVDDGGDPHPVRKDPKKNVTAEMFNGLDLVWPQPVEPSDAAKK